MLSYNLMGLTPSLIVEWVVILHYKSLKKAKHKQKTKNKKTHFLSLHVHLDSPGASSSYVTLIKSLPSP